MQNELNLVLIVFIVLVVSNAHDGKYFSLVSLVKMAYLHVLGQTLLVCSELLYFTI